MFQTLKNVTWFKERTLTEITLGGLLILVVIRTIQFNMTRMRVIHSMHVLHNASAGYGLGQETSRHAVQHNGRAVQFSTTDAPCSSTQRTHHAVQHNRYNRCTMQFNTTDTTDAPCSSTQQMHHAVQHNRCTMQFSTTDAPCSSTQRA